MMGALGNVRRGGRSPSLMMAALISCVLLLGFNYWVSNSKISELQSRIMEMKGHMRELAAERDQEQQSKLKAMEEISRQKDQMELLEETHQRQQENTLITWKHERDKLKFNISSSIKTVQDMKNRMKSVMEDVNKSQSELKSCQSNMDTLNKKATSEMTQCNKQIEATKDECNEKIAAAKLEKQKTSEKVALQNADGSIEKVSVSKAKSDVPTTNHSDKNVAESPKGKPDVGSQSKNDAHVQTNKLLVEKDEKGAVILQPIPSSKVANKNETLKKPANEKVPEAVVDVKAQASKAADTVKDKARILDPKEEDIGIGDPKEEYLGIGDPKKDGMGIGDPKKDDMGIGDPKKHDMWIGDPKEEDLGIGDQKKDDMGIGDPKEEDLGIGDPKKDDMGIGDPKEDDIGIRDPKEEDLGIGDQKKDDLGIGDPKKDDLGNGDPKKDDMRIGDKREEDANIEDRKDEDAAGGKEGAIMYENEGEIEKQLSKIKDENQGVGQDLADDVANYNGDDENQPESEDEKQAELAEIWN
ncbi:Golgi membrane protein 1-like isoform X2 [Carassius carassius]|uniref:Golgi membrane protein 1-like isoform X2 n=1 Tax=Carassius carassius TaxID=217509 RepID=UPI0028685B7B|nr:Golgi membrane protein 1-like isoform X2 [Carassius carassius]